MAILITIWGTRLSYNFYRKGGYSMDAEDYRWKIVKKKFDSVSKYLWEPFHLGFIVLY
jgi:steroid 5-alpha reductase family enzyme